MLKSIPSSSYGFSAFFPSLTFSSVRAFLAVAFPFLLTQKCVERNMKECVEQYGARDEKKINLFKFSWLIRQCAASHRSEQQHWLSANTSTEGKSKIGRFCGIGWVRLEYPQNICQLLLLFVSERTQTSTSKPVECYTKISLIIMHHLFDSEKGNSRIYSYVTRYIVSQDANLPKLICVFFY